MSYPIGATVTINNESSPGYGVTGLVSEVHEGEVYTVYYHDGFLYTATFAGLTRDDLTPWHEYHRGETFFMPVGRATAYPATDEQAAEWQSYFAKNS